MFHVYFPRHLEVGQAFPEDLPAEAGIEILVDFRVAFEAHVGEVVFLGHEIQLLEHFRMAAAGVESVYGDAAFLRLQKSCCQVEQCALAHSVLAQQSVDAAFAELERQPLKNSVLVSRIAEGEVVYLNHKPFLF